MDKETLQKIADHFSALAEFTATARVDSCAIGPDRTICQPGDKIVINQWYCFNGPTSLTVNGRQHCIPFSWVIEMGAPAELASYMPFAPKTWSEVLSEYAN